MGHVFSCLNGDIDCDFYKAVKDKNAMGSVAHVPAGEYMFVGKTYGVKPDECIHGGGKWDEKIGGCHFVVNAALCGEYAGKWDDEHKICTVTFDQHRPDNNSRALAARATIVDDDGVVNTLVVWASLMAVLLVIVIIVYVFFTRRHKIKSLKQARSKSTSSSELANSEEGAAHK